MHGTEVACLFKLGHYGKTCKCFFFPVSTSRVEKVLLHEINYRSIISQSLQEAFCLTVQLKMFHSHLFVPTFLVIWYSHFFNCVLWDFLGRSCSLFPQIFSLMLSEEEKIERVFLFVIDCVRGVMSYRFGRWVHDVPTTYVCLQYRSHRHQK